MEHGTSRHKDVDTGGGGTGSGVDVDPAVDLELDVEVSFVDEPARLTHLVEHRLGERLTAPARVHAHRQQQIDLVEIRLHRVERRRRVVRQTDSHAERAHLVEQRTRIAELDVHRAAIGAGVRERVEEVGGIVDHQVAVEEQLGVLAHRLDDRRPDGEVVDEVAVHHVDVQQIGVVGDPVDVGREAGEVGRENRRGELHGCKVTGRPPGRSRRRSTNIPSVPATWGKRSAPRPHGRHGAPGGGSATRSGSVVAAQSSTPRVSSSVSVQTAYTTVPPGRTARLAACSRSRCSAASAAAPDGRARQRASGAPPQHPQPGARRVDAAPDRTTAAGTAVPERRQPRRARSSSASRHAAVRTSASRLGAHVARDHRAAGTHALGDRRRLAARRGGEVEHALPRLRVEHADNRLARLILRRRPTLGDSRQARRIAAAAHCERIRHERAACDRDACRHQLCFERRDGGTRRVGSKRHRRRDVVGIEDRARIVGPVQLRELLDEPFGMRGAHCDRGGVIAVGPRPLGAETRRARGACR